MEKGEISEMEDKSNRENQQTTFNVNYMAEIELGLCSPCIQIADFYS